MNIGRIVQKEGRNVARSMMLKMSPENIIKLRPEKKGLMSVNPISTAKDNSMMSVMGW